MNIFLTGGTGFIGSHFINAAHEAGIEIVAQRRGPNSKPRVPLAREPRWVERALDAIETRDFEGCDAVVHLAAHTPNVPYDSFERCHFWNVTAPLRMFERALEAGVRRWTVAGTCFEYGRSCERYDFIPTDAPLEPVLSYPTSKAAASVAFAGLARSAEVSLRIGRIFQVFGEGEAETRLWPAMRKAAREGRDFPLSPGEQVRDFIPVEEVARQFVCELLAPPAPKGEPEIFHVCTGKPQTLRNFAEFWWREWKAPGRLLFGATPYRAGEMMRIAGVMTKLPSA
jgi:nucleoside-diphosphate-sugar epimerase